MEQEKEYQELEPGTMVIDPSDTDFVQVPDGEPFKMHIASVRLIEAPNYHRTANETKLVIGFELDEDIEGKGQIFTGWFTPSLNPKSNLHPLVMAVFGELKAIDPAVDLPGMPLRVTVENKEKDGVIKQYPKSYLKPAKDQTKVEPKDDDIDVMDIDSIIESAKK